MSRHRRGATVVADDGGGTNLGISEMPSNNTNRDFTTMESYAGAANKIARTANRQLARGKISSSPQSGELYHPRRKITQCQRNRR